MIEPDEHGPAPVVVVIALGLFGSALFALLLGYAMQVDDCAKRGGVHVRATTWSGYACVRSQP